MRAAVTVCCVFFRESGSRCQNACHSQQKWTQADLSQGKGNLGEMTRRFYARVFCSVPLKLKVFKQLLPLPRRDLTFVSSAHKLRSTVLWR